MMKRFLFITICLCLLLTSFISTSVAASFPDPNSKLYELNDNSNMSASFMENLGEANRAYNALLASFRSAYNSNGIYIPSTERYSVSCICADGFPTYFCGAYINHYGNLVVLLSDSLSKTEKDKAEKHISTIAESTSIVFGTAHYSYSDLINIMSDIQRVVSDDDTYSDCVVSFGIDDYGNRIIVGMKSIDSTVLEWFRNTISDHSAIAFVEDDNAVFSVSCGQQIQGNNELISIGYRAKHIGANNNITKGFVTCGHAFYGAQSSSLAVQYNGSTIGTWTSAFQSFADGGYADAAFITKSGSTDITPQVVSSNSDPTINIGTAGYVDVAQGSTVFEQGAIRDLYYGTYGTGTITLSSYSSSHTLNQTTTIHLYDMVKTNYTAMVGDSGGIVFTYSSTAYYPCGCQSSILTNQTQYVWINGVKIFYGDGVYSKAVNIDSVLGGIYVR